MWKINFYQTNSGRSPVLDYLNKLEKNERARVMAALAQIEQFGLKALKVRFRQIEGKLWELKISMHRIFYVIVRGENMLLLHAYKKQSQNTPRQEREIALKRIKEVLT